MRSNYKVGIKHINLDGNKKRKKEKKKREKPLDRSYGPIISKNITCTTGFLLYIWKTSIPSLFVFFTYCPFIYIYIYIRKFIWLVINRKVTS